MDERDGRYTPAAALSALGRIEDRHRTEDAGFQLHIAKPVDPVELATAVSQLSRAAVGSKN
jgi:CheY-like chemotaxis protein